MTPDIEMEDCGKRPAFRLVLGDPLEVLDTTLVPVISVTGAYGKTADGQGGGGGFALNPVAIVALQKNGIINVYSLQPQVPMEKLSAVISTLPQYLNREETNAHRD